MASCCGKTKKEDLDPIEEILGGFDLTPADLVCVMEKMGNAMTRGLRGRSDEDVRMFPTFVRMVPSSKETGKFLSMDLGFSILVISLVELKGKHIAFNEMHGASHSANDGMDDLTENRTEAQTAGRTEIRTEDWTEVRSGSMPRHRSPYLTPGVSLSPLDSNKNKVAIDNDYVWTSSSYKSGSIHYQSLCINLPCELRTGKGEDLMKFLAKNLKKFLMECDAISVSWGKTISMGFCFPCPCRKSSPSSGVLTNWTKGYDCEGMVGEDVTHMLQEALDKNGMSHVRIVVLLNDTLATMLAGAYGPSTGTVLVGVMLGTGSNAVYQERMENITPGINKGQLSDYQKSLSTKNPIECMIIDTEWGAFGESCGELEAYKTEFDRQVDKSSKDPGKDVYGKLICGAYIGEVVRLILVKLHEEGVLLPNEKGPIMAEASQWKFTTKIMSQIESDRGITFAATKAVLTDFGLRGVDNYNCRIIKKVCETVTTRAAYLAAAGVAAIIRRIPRDLVTVAIDGSMLRQHPHFIGRFENMISALLKARPSILVPRQRFALKLITDGAVIGSAIAAACYHRDLTEVEKANHKQD